MLGAKPNGDWVLLVTRGIIHDSVDLVVPYDPNVAEQALGLMRTGLLSMREMHQTLAPILTPDLSALFAEQATLTDQLINKSADCLEVVWSGADHTTCTAALLAVFAESREKQSRVLELAAAISTASDKLTADLSIPE